MFKLLCLLSWKPTVLWVGEGGRNAAHGHSVDLHCASVFMNYSVGTSRNSWEKRVIPCWVWLHLSSIILFFDRKNNFKWMGHNIKECLEGMLLMEQKNLIQLGELYLVCCKKISVLKNTFFFTVALQHWSHLYPILNINWIYFYFSGEKLEAAKPDNTQEIVIASEKYVLGKKMEALGWLLGGWFWF